MLNAPIQWPRLYLPKTVIYNGEFLKPEIHKNISVEEALKIALSGVPMMEPEQVPIIKALGRVAFQNVDAGRDQPPWDNSAMDGFALHWEDIKIAGPSTPIILNLAGELRAGDLSEASVPKGAAIRIMTGAPIPPGTDMVVPKEDTRTEGDQVVILKAGERWGYIRRRGEDFQAGDPVIRKGQWIRPSDVGMAASVGCAQITVFRKPRVAILSTGNELCPLEKKIGINQIYDANSYAIGAQVEEAGGTAHFLGIARDTREDIRKALSKASNADLVLISGGVSVGEYDYVKEVLLEMGAALSFWRVAMKPGAPLAYGHWGRIPVFGLPGNPVSAMLTFEEFVRPVIRKMIGHTRLVRESIEAVVTESIKKPKGKVTYIRAVLRGKDGDWKVHATGNQSSGVLTSMVKADGLIIVPAEKEEVSAGEKVRFRPLHSNFPEEASPPPPNHFGDSSIDAV